MSDINKSRLNQRAHVLIILYLMGDHSSFMLAPSRHAAPWLSLPVWPDCGPNHVQFLPFQERNLTSSSNLKVKFKRIQCLFLHRFGCCGEYGGKKLLASVDCQWLHGYRVISLLPWHGEQLAAKKLFILTQARIMSQGNFHFCGREISQEKTSMGCV